jgi:hypothetical protein
VVESCGVFQPTAHYGFFFIEQCEPWDIIVGSVKAEVVQGVRNTVEVIIPYITGDTRHQSRHQAQRAGGEPDEESSHDSQQGVFKSVQNAQSVRFRARFEAVMEECAPDRDLRTGRFTTSLAVLAPKIEEFQPDLERQSCETAVEYASLLQGKLAVALSLL